MNDQCVYTHVHPQNKTVFYVGMGVIKRAYDFKNRNRFWKRIVNEFGTPEVNIIAQNLEPEKAYDTETEAVDAAQKINRVDQDHKDVKRV